MDFLEHKCHFLFKTFVPQCSQGQKWFLSQVYFLFHTLMEYIFDGGRLLVYLSYYFIQLRTLELVNNLP